MCDLKQHHEDGGARAERAAIIACAPTAKNGAFCSARKLFEFEAAYSAPCRMSLVIRTNLYRRIGHRRNLKILTNIANGYRTWRRLGGLRSRCHARGRLAEAIDGSGGDNRFCQA